MLSYFHRCSVSYGRAKTIWMRYVWTRIFFLLWQTEGKNLRFQKIYGYMWTASHFGCALAHRRSDSAVSIRLMLNCDMFRFQYWGPYETTMVTACTGSSEKRQANKIGLTRETTRESRSSVSNFCTIPYAIMGLIILSRTDSLSRGDFYPGIKKIKVMFHGTIRIDNFQRNTLSQCCNHSKQYRNNVATLCCAKNRFCESRSRITSHLNNDEGGGNGNGKKNQ